MQMILGQIPDFIDADRDGLDWTEAVQMTFVPHIVALVAGMHSNLLNLT